MLLIPAILMSGDASSFEEVYPGLFLVKHKSITVKHSWKKVQVPIFRGSLDNIDYSDIDIALEDHLLVKNQTGNLTKDFQEFIEFYRESLFENIDADKPTVVGIEGEGCLDYIIWYDFKYKGIKSSMMISVPRIVKKNHREYLRISDLEIKNNAKYFYYSIFIGKSSNFIEESN